MILAVIFLIYLFINYKNNSINNVLSIIILISVSSAILIGKTSKINEVIDLFNLIYVSMILLIIVHSYKNYESINTIYDNHNIKSFIVITNVMLILGLFVLVINIYIMYSSFELMLLESLKITEFKNEGGASEFIDSLIDDKLLFLSRLITPIGYLALPLHFYFLSKRKTKLSVIFLIISLNIPVQGLQALSRAAAVQYIILYLLLFIYSFNSIPRKYKKICIIIMITLLFNVVIALGLISTDRFSDYNMPTESYIKDPVLYSLVDYASQWNENSIVVMEKYENNKLLFGKSSFGLFDFVLIKIGFDIETLHEARVRVYGLYYSTKFTGIVTNLLYDFGYTGGFLFALLFFKIVRYNSPFKRQITLTKYMSFAMTVSIPAMFYANNYLTNVMYNLAIIYTLVFIFIIKRKIKIK